LIYNKNSHKKLYVEGFIMKKFKKVISVTMAAAMMASLTACGSSSDTASTASDAAATAESAVSEAVSEAEAAKSEAESAVAEAAATTSDKVYNIGIVQQLEHPALDNASQGFEDALTEKLGDSVTFDLQNAQGEQANCATISNNFVANNVDLILANATTALQCAAAATADIPILGTSITDYATALDIDDWTGTTGTNISGTSDLAPIDEQENMLVELFPDAQNVAILYCSAEPNSKYQATEFEKALDADGISYKEFTAADSNDIPSVTQSAVEYADVIYIPTDNTMAANTEAINNITLPAGIPVIAGEEGICSGCGIATLSISYYDIGYRAGEMAYEILVNGADVSTMEIEYAPQVTKEYNASIAEELGITIPDDYVAIEE
jgi:putative ABC transport system substrate-binding protein